MRFSMGWIALLAPLALLVFASPAAAQTTSGEVSGRWYQIDGGHTGLDAIVFDAKGAPAYSIEARLIGRDFGRVEGVMTSLPKKPRGNYELVGTFTKAEFGRVQMNAKILTLDSDPVLVIGSLTGVLDVDPNTYLPDPGKVKPVRPVVPDPRVRPTRGHFHGRWRLF